MAVAYVMDVQRAARVARERGDPDVADLLAEIADRKSRMQPDMDRFGTLCDRFDNLYYPNDVLAHAGASHWAEHPSAVTPGRAHVSLNVPPVYVDVPAALQSVVPIENMVSLETSDAGRNMAALVERLYFAWKDEEKFDLKTHQACVVKGLYGRTAAKVYWDADENRPCLRVVDQPRNLYLGWGTSDYTRLDWALYTYRQSPEGVYEDWGLEIGGEQERAGDNILPFVLPSGRGTIVTSTARPWLNQMGLEVEVYDYWYRKPKAKQRKSQGAAYKGIQHETWNAIFVGNELVKNAVYPEYKGKIPYVVLFNTYVPGVPDGRPELYDIESLLREKDERITQGAQMLGRTVDGQLWQLVGPEAPDVVPTGVIPKPNKVVAPGAGNRIEAITPWMPEFQLEQYLSRLDRELNDVSGLNDLLRGMAPQAVLSSGKAITALVANYESRIRMKRDLLYLWRREVWEMASMLWAAKVPALRPVLSGVARLEISPPSLTPRDDMETSAMAANLVQSKLWTLKRGMDRVGVDDPEAELDILREESTDASIFPERVQVMAQLMTVLQSLGYGSPPGADQQAQQQAQSLASFRQQLGGQSGVPSLNAPGEQATPPPEAQPGNTPGGAPLSGPIRSQTMVQGGQGSGRLLSETKIQPGG